MASALLALTLLVVGSNPEPNIEPATGPELEGRWKVIWIETDCKMPMLDHVVVHVGTIQFWNGTEAGGSFRLSWDASRQWLDLQPTLFFTDSFCPGIFRWDGEQLMICSGFNERPSEFTARKGSLRSLFILEAHSARIPQR